MTGIDPTSAHSMAPICVENLSKVFRTKKRRLVQALDTVSFQVAAGEVFGFLGPNGAGKSTTIKTLLGLIRPTSGAVRLCGLDACDPQARRNVGYLPENPALYDFLSAKEYLHFVCRSFAMPDAQIAEAIEQVLIRLDLIDAAHRPIRGYSKGMVQRLALGQTLIHDPQVYILDEPMSGLDPQGRALVKEIMLELKGRGKTVFFSTHITADVEKICDRMAIVVGGKLRAIETVHDLLDQGVTGYRVVACGVADDLIAERHGELRPSGEAEFRVVKAEIGALVEQITQQGGRVELVEPLRRDLEAYFLDVVEGAA